MAVLLAISQATIEFMRDSVWQGIGSIATIIGLLLSIRGILTEKSNQSEKDQIKLLQAELDHLKDLLRKGVIYHQTTAPPQKAPLGKMQLA